MILALVAASALSISVYRTIRWTLLGIAGKDPVRRFSATDRALLIARAGHKCEQHFLWFWRCRTTTNLEADHVHPHSKGGKTHIENGQVLCARHNKQKSARIPYNWELRLLAKSRTAYFPPGTSVRVIRRPRS
ncbi:MAG: HNH endonuclease [Actinomycetota bacterium]|nr:HNH endonuclease [Actinomycetota bacterium]